MNAFYGCNNLSSITIGSGVTTVINRSFSQCSELTDVYCLAENVPRTSSDAFDGSYIEYATLHVPEQSIDAYKAASPWNKFKNIVGDATGITKIQNNPVQIHHENGNLIVEGVEEGTMVSVYDIKGVQIASAMIEGGRVSIPTNQQNTNIAIVKINGKSIKVIIK
jgi:uncharacterized secreted protein with C-terminal beta-propeller domain